MAELDPGVQAGGFSASAGYTTKSGRTFGASISPKGGFGADTKEFDKLHKSLVQVDSDLKKIDATVKSLNTSLAKIKFPGQPSSGVGGSALTIASVSGGKGTQATGGGGLHTPTFGGQPMGGGSGQGQRAFGLGVASEVGAGFAGSINRGISNILGGGTAQTQLYAYQNAARFGRGTGNGVLTSYAGMNANSPADLAAAQGTLQSNQFLSAFPGGSRNQRNLNQFTNALSGINPSLGAAGAASFASQLTSPQALNFFNRTGAASGVVTNSKTGAINNPQQIFSKLITSLYGGRSLTSSQMKSIATSQSSSAQFSQSAEMNLGLNSQDIQTLLQYMGSGGNLPGAQNGVKGAVASTTFQRNATGTRLKTTAFEGASGTENTLNKIEQWTQSTANTLLKAFPAAAGGADAAGKIVSGGLGAASKYWEIKALKSVLGKGAGGADGAEGIIAKIGTAGGVAALGDLLFPALAVGALAVGAKKLGDKVGLSNWSGLGGGKSISSITPAEFKQATPEEQQGLRNLGYKGDPSTGSTTTAGMTPSMSQKIGAMQRENPSVQVTSGHRSARQQRALYAMKGGRGVARPGQSQHELGKAADLGPTSQHSWIARNARRFGLYHPDSKEPWHLQSMGDPVNTSGAASGYVSAITSAGKKYGVDPNVLLAVSSQEGLGGGVGDRGTSFGPFQLHVGGALPAGKGQSWAQSAAGINYAVQQIAGVTRGLSGATAIASAVKNFERPADIPGETARAISVFGGGKVDLAALGAVGGGSKGGSAKSSATSSSGGDGTSSSVLTQLLQALMAKPNVGLGGTETMLGGGKASGDPWPSASPVTQHGSGGGMAKHYNVTVKVEKLMFGGSGSEADLEALGTKLAAAMNKADERKSVGNS